MKVELFDRFVDVKKLKLGTVLFVVQVARDPDTWTPRHITGFAQNSPMKAKGIMVDGIYMEYRDLAWDNEN